MTALEMGELNAEILQNLGTIAEDETVLARVAKYLRRVVKEMDADPTLMSKDDFFARVDEAKKGPTYTMLPDEDLTSFLKRQGYEI